MICWKEGWRESCNSLKSIYEAVAVSSSKSLPSVSSCFPQLPQSDSRFQEDLPPPAPDSILPLSPDRLSSHRFLPDWILPLSSYRLSSHPFLFPISMSNRVLCKYFAHGACLKGEYCEFSHDWSSPANNICTYYQKGICSYGSRCRYDHVKPSEPDHHAISSSSNTRSYLTSDLVPQALQSPNVASDGTFSACSQEELSSSHRPLDLPTTPAWNLDVQVQDHLEDGNVLESRVVNPADRPLCSFAAVGNCPRGMTCPHIHGDLCPTCGKNCLHPFRPQEREEHMATCQKKKSQLEALKHSQEIECSVCLEPVLSKPTAAERKFGILSECDHPFCITCIRNWRNSSPTPGMDVNSALRTCPICRKLSYFIIPSVIWYTTKEEKQEIIDSYKAKLKSIDCKHFDFGNGSCPFGTSCFYKHAYRDGRLEEVVLRHLSDEDGQTVIAKNIRLSDFLSDLHLR